MPSDFACSTASWSKKAFCPGWLPTWTSSNWCENRLKQRVGIGRLASADVGLAHESGSDGTRVGAYIIEGVLPGEWLFLHQHSLLFHSLTRFFDPFFTALFIILHHEVLLLRFAWSFDYRSSSAYTYRRGEAWCAC